MSLKKASIIVPCYKVEKYLPRCLDSLVNQTLDDIEIICVNDGSPDNCLSILKDYKQRYPEKIVIIDKENEGVWRGRLDGIALAQGEYIGFVDSDDYVEPNFAEDLYYTAHNNDADVSVAGFSRIEFETEKPISKEMCSPRPPFNVQKEPGRLIELNGAPWNKFFKASILKNIKDIQSPPPVLDDLIFHLLAYKNMTGTVVFTPKKLINYRVRNDSIINTIDPQKLIKGYDSFLEVKQIYLDEQVSQDLLSALDTIAFLHLGVSMTYRLASTEGIDLKESINKTTYFLDNYFPEWKTSPYMKASYTFRNKGAFTKLYIVSKIYKANLLKTFLTIYQKCTELTGRDIKW